MISNRTRADKSGDGSRSSPFSRSRLKTGNSPREEDHAHHSRFTKKYDSIFVAKAKQKAKFLL